MQLKMAARWPPFNSRKSRINKLTLSPCRILILLKYCELITNLCPLYTPPNPKCGQLFAASEYISLKKNRTEKPATSVTEQVTKRNIKRKWRETNLVLQPLPMKRRKRDMTFVDKSLCLKPIFLSFFFDKKPSRLEGKSRARDLGACVWGHSKYTCFLELIARIHFHALSSTFR